MQVLVLTNENGEIAHLKEHRDEFDVAEFRLSYTCQVCGNEFIFKPEKSEPRQKWAQCPVCGKNLEIERADTLHPDVLLWEALSLYRAFYNFVIKHKLDLKLVLTEKEE